MKPNEKLDIRNILMDLNKYRPRRRGWTWRDIKPIQMGEFRYEQVSQGLTNFVPLPGARYLNNIDPQPDAVITSEIASGRFEDDIRRMRMAAYHGADHIMVIRTAGQSHIDGLLEGTPQGVGGIPITRKQVRAQRKALDIIEDEVGRPINYHSYVSGVAGPEIAVMFVEEGVNGAHQDPQYNVLYRNVNMLRSYVDAAESKKIMAYGNMAQIDGAHNANATARDAWKVMPELLVQHAINSRMSERIGISPDLICLSTVPPAASPSPDLKLNLPYAIALREFFDKYRMRAQMNTKYISSSTREATVTHVLNLLISRMTSADIQSTITPDEGRNVPWHMYNIEALDTAKQAMAGLDDLMSMIEFKKEGYLPNKVREIQERAVLMLEEILEMGGYFKAVEEGMFVDSGYYPERSGDGIIRKSEGGIGNNTIIKRASDYLAPVTAHYGYNNVEQYNVEYINDPAKLIDKCTFEDPDLIQYIDELDEEDNVNNRLDDNEKYRSSSLIKPEVQWLGDGVITFDLVFPVASDIAEASALLVAKNMGLLQPEIIHVEVLHPSEGTRVQVKGVLNFDIDTSKIVIPKKEKLLDDDEITNYVKKHKLKVVAGTGGNDEHSVGMREILDIKHGGIEKYGFDYTYLGTSVSIEKFIDAAIEVDADCVLISLIISHDDIHYKNMKKLNDYAIEKGVRDKLLLIAGGTQITPALARKQGIDQGFARGTKGKDVASFIVKRHKQIHES
ncbi:MAG: D-ornithine 4,5-aminomutase subunit OraE [Bacilli bacterium]|nr:D-ornithine 4,5-aminomutase subunit OraE [Bacilli bacterium]MDD2682152.1 D-ornithine 4,5-aminomutase subunit OraE [Bacilli bacterium]MDD3121031.1 D-ornithine 4,5-aminomutase subunit OraE [Bacilli bacterium]MDD4063205.1 D-ornithine 4,5-aminomutase subunit OraE [Bacilli bacterium]MDD4481845.1 D-ornithine 4,5-aminomutase subunit OraE [Bacilli bacterium]